MLGRIRLLTLSLFLVFRFDVVVVSSHLHGHLSWQGAKMSQIPCLCHLRTILTSLQAIASLDTESDKSLYTVMGERGPYIQYSRTGPLQKFMGPSLPQ